MKRKTAKKEPSHFDTALSEAARDFAKEMGNIPAGKNNPVRDPGTGRNEPGYLSNKKISVKAGK